MTGRTFPSPACGRGIELPALFRRRAWERLWETLEIKAFWIPAEPGISGSSLLAGRNRETFDREPGAYSTSSTATVRPERRWASEASMNGSRSPSSTSAGVPETWPVRRSFTI